MAQFLDEVGSFAPRTYAGEIRDNICNKPVESSQMILVEEKYGWMDFLPGTAVVARVALDRVAADAGVGDQFECALVGRLAAPCVHAIGERYEGFAPLYRRELLGDRKVDGVIEAGRVATFDRADRALYFAAVTREIAEEVYLLVKGYYQRPVVRLELLDESVTTTGTVTRAVLSFIASGRCGSCSELWPCPSARNRGTGHGANANERTSPEILLLDVLPAF
jgi:hypothetical protein